jgi:Zn-dependent metalloprotease
MPYATAGSRSLTLGLFLFAILAYTSAAFGQVEPDTVRRNAWQQFQDQRGPEWTVRWNPETGTPASVTSGLTKPYSSPPVQAAKTFLQEHRQLFGMEPELSNLQLRSADKLREVTHVRFQQTYRDIPVYEA